MELANYPINELQDLKRALENQMKNSVDAALSLQKWYDRVTEALADATEGMNNEEYYEENGRY